MKNNGFKLEAMRDRPTPKKKKPRKSKPLEEEEDVAVTPHTPVQVLQRVGRLLEIPEGELTEDRLIANLKQDKPKNVNDD